MKRKQKVGLALIILLHLMGNVWYFQQDIEGGKLRDGSRCGKVISNFTELSNVKHGTRTDYFLKVQYNEYSQVENVSAQTFHENYAIGSNICFYNNFKGYLQVLTLLIFMTNFGLLLVSVGFVIWCIISFFNGKWI